MTETRDPAGTGVSSPLANRTSSSPTYTLTKRRKLPASSTIRPARPGYAASRLAMTSRRVPGSAFTSAEPPVNVRRMVGIRTETLMDEPPFLGVARSSMKGVAGSSIEPPRYRPSRGGPAGVRGLPGLECGQRGPDPRLDAVRADRVQRLQAVAGIDDDGLCAGVEQAVGEQ